MKSSALFLLPLVSLAGAINLVLSIVPSQNVPNPSLLPSTTKATIHATNITRTAPLTRANSFRFDDLSPQSYLVTVQCRDFYFSPLRVDVALDEQSGSHRLDAWQTFWGNEWSNKGELRGNGTGDLDVIVDIKAEKPKEYFLQRAGFSPMSFLKNPMVLMGLFSLVAIVGIPKIMDNMDDETKAEFEEMRKTGRDPIAINPSASLQNFDVAGWLAGSSKSSASTADASSASKKR